VLGGTRCPQRVGKKNCRATAPIAAHVQRQAMRLPYNQIILRLRRVAVASSSEKPIHLWPQPRLDAARRLQPPFRRARRSRHTNHHHGLGRGWGVGRTRGIGLGLGVGVGRGVEVGVAVGVGDGVTQGVSVYVRDWFCGGESGQQTQKSSV
jgi:hypothetical protein